MGMTTSSSVVEAGSRRVPPLPWTLKWEAADQPVWSDARASQAVISAVIAAKPYPARARAAANVAGSGIGLRCFPRAVGFRKLRAEAILAGNK